MIVDIGDPSAICMILLLEEADSAYDCSSLSIPAHDTFRTYSIGDAEDELDVGSFDADDPGCSITYQT